METNCPDIYAGGLFEKILTDLTWNKEGTIITLSELRKFYTF